MENNEHIVKTGTTTVGLICKDGIVLAADKRATSGYLVADKMTDKISNLNDNIVVTMAGTASDAQLMIKLSQSEIRLKKIRTSQEVTVKEAANLMARMVYNNVRRMSMIPGISHFIMGGIDNTGFYLYDIFADGTITECKDFISSGSGSVMAYGVLETMYKPGLSLDEGISIVKKCVNAAIQRDIASGNGIDIYTVTSAGAKKVFHQEIESKIES